MFSVSHLYSTLQPQPTVEYTVYIKRLQQLVIIVRCFLIRTHIFMVSLCIRAGSILRRFLPNMLCFFTKRTTIRQTCCIFPREVTQSLYCGTSQDNTLSGVASKCGVHSGIKKVQVRMPHLPGPLLCEFVAFWGCIL